MKNILITGGSGMIGTALTQELLKKEYSVIHTGRSAKAAEGVKKIVLDSTTEDIPTHDLKNIRGIIHLAGAGIADKRWTSSRKSEILHSRTAILHQLNRHFQKETEKPDFLVSASAVGYYGSVTSQTIFVESDPAASDFLGEVCEAWEEAADTFIELGTRVVKLRIGVVISSEGGALSKMARPIKMGVGSPLGNGKQYMPWIHVDDLVQLFITACENSTMAGAYNAVAPQHINNKEFTQEIAHALNKKLILPHVPSFVMKAMLGEMATIVLEGSRVSSERMEEIPFLFKYNTVAEALEEAL